MTTDRPDGAALLEAIRTGPKRALATALTALETDRTPAQNDALLDAALASPAAASSNVIGLTGPPGVGKSTLTDALIQHWNAAGLGVAVLAVDPSSQTTGGALLGDRTRMAGAQDRQGCAPENQHRPRSPKLFIRSAASRGALGGINPHVLPAIVLLRAVFDRVIVETVGVGQSEAEITRVCDTVVLCIQPGSGDALQFMKAGIMEVPDVIVITKADMGALAQKTEADLRAALSLTVGVRAANGGVLTASAARWEIPIVRTAAPLGEGIAQLAGALDRNATWATAAGVRTTRRRGQVADWTTGQLKDRFGHEGLQVASRLSLIGEQSALKTPFADARRALASLSVVKRAVPDGL